MIEKILYWLHGYLVLQLQHGDLSRFLNLCKVNEIQLLDVKQKDFCMLLHLSKKNYENIKPFIVKCQVDAEIIKQVGLCSIVKKYRKRIVFLLCFLVFFFFLFFTSKFVWHISVDGESAYTEEEIIIYVEQNYIPVGTRISSIQISDLERELREYFDHVAWVTCEIKGTNLIIHMVETINPQVIPHRDEACNIVAIKDALITDITATCGKKMVDTGDEVKKGDILITGVVHVQNEYEETIETTYVAADGIVYGQTKYDYLQEISLTSTKKYYTGKYKTCYLFDFWGNEFRIKNPKHTEHCDLETELHKFRLFDNYYLPITFTRRIYHEFEYKQETMTPEQAEKKQQEILDIYLEGLRKKGVEILQNNVKIECVNGVSIARGNIVVKEIIGVPEAFTDIAVEDLEK